MEVTHKRIEVGEASQASDARRAAARIGRNAGLGEIETGELEIVVTEAATNLVKHGGGGEVLLRVLEDGPRRGVEMLALDSGAGMADVAASSRDGASTAGTPGTGLGAIHRLAADVEIYSAPRHGTALLARIWPRAGLPARNGHLRTGAVCVPKRGEEVSGDAWDVVHGPGRCAVLLADGLGHGADAAIAASEAIRLFRANPWSPPAETLERIHAGLRATRGAAVAVAVIEPEPGIVLYAGLGNIAGQVLAHDARARSMVSHHGTAGHDARRIGEFQYPWSHGSSLVMHSDGLGTHWDLEAYHGLALRHPTLVAAVLYRDHQRGRDDTTVVIVRENM
jgi:anti-sigma regulatory factor (Ser/Thr protein kinase)